MIFFVSIIFYCFCVKLFGRIFWLYNMEKNTTKILRNSLHDFVCKKCDYTWSRKSDFNKHLKSKKHNTTNATKIQPKILHHCECGKKYAYRASLFSKIVSTGLVFLVSTTSQVTFYYPLHCTNVSFL